MTFTEIKRQTLVGQKERHLSTFFIALGVAAAMFVPYILMSEGYFIFYGDFNVQQIPFYQMCHEAIRNGNFGWNWLTDLGANFIGSYSFYLLGSPFFWLTLPFPNHLVPYLMGPLLILKFSCAALTAYCYIRRFTKTPEAAQLGGLLYAFSGFSVYNIFFNHFHEPLIFFPLLLLAMELLLTENRRGLFAVAVAVCALTNYFFFFGMVVFSIIYFFVRLFTGTYGFGIGRFFVLLFEAVLGLALSAVLLLPSCLAVLGNSRVSDVLLGWSAMMYGKEHIYANVLQCFFFPPDLPARPVFFPNANVKWSSLGGWLPVFSVVGLFVLCFEKKKNWMKRILGICIFMALVPILNSMFYAFNVSYYARWFYMPILILCLATVTLTEDRGVDWWRGWRWVFFITLGVTLTIGLFPQENDEGKLIFGLYTQGDDLTYVLRYWGACAISLVSLLVLGLLLRLLKTDRTAFYRAAIACVCAVSILYGNVFIATGRSHSYLIKEVMIDQLIEGEVALDDGDYRIDVYSGVDNTGMYLGLPTINAFHSVVPSSIVDFYDYIGISRTVGSRPPVDDVPLRSLLSVKYLLNRTDGESFINEDGETKMSGYGYRKTSGGYYVYENENYIPYGFSYNYYMTEDFCNAYEEDSRTALMLKAMLLNEQQVAKYGDWMTDLSTLYDQDWNTDEEEATTLSISDKAMTLDAKRLQETAADHFEIDQSGFTATVSRERKSLVFFSVPYDEGWSVKVNGERAEMEKVNVGFMAVPVPAGRSTIEFTYTTPGLSDGIRITVGAIVLLAVYLLLFFIFRTRHHDRTAYPEGDKMLRLWRAEEMLDRKEQTQDEEEPSHSIFDDQPIVIPKVHNGFTGGFTVDPSIFDEKK